MTSSPSCWILNKSNTPFSVKVEKSDTVDELKEVIMKEKEYTLVGIDADSLDIWKVSASSLHVSIRRSDVWGAIPTYSIF